MNMVLTVLVSFLDALLIDSINFSILRRKNFPRSGLAIFLLASTAINITLTLSGVHYNITFAVFLVAALVYSLLFYTGNVVLKTFATLLLGIVILSGDQLSTGVVMLLFPGADNPEILETTRYHMTGTITFHIYIAAMIVVFYRFPIHTDNISKNRSIAMMGVPISAGIMVFLTNTYWDGLPYVSGWAYILPFSLFLLLVVFTLLYCRIAEKSERKQRELDVLNTQLDQFGESYQSFIGNMQDIRTFRHDIAHHYNIIHSLAAEGKLEDVADYIHDIHPVIEGVANLPVTQNAVVGTLIRQKKAFAEKHGISFSERVTIPEYIGIPSPDICVILSNALDNAIEACRKIETGERKIDVSIFLRKPCMFIYIENTIAEQPVMKDGIILSTKEQRNEHGFGLMSIRRLIQKHGGDVLPEWYDDRFLLNCSIKLPNEVWEVKND